MKKSIALAAVMIVSFVIPTVAVGEMYVREGVTWQTLITPDEADKSPFIEYVTAEKSAQEGCLDLYRYYNEDMSDKELVCIVRTEEDKVFFRPKDDTSDEWYLFYDFRPGEFPEIYSPILTTEDSKPLKSAVRRMEQFSTSEPVDDRTDTGDWVLLGLNEYEQKYDGNPIGAMAWIKGLSSQNGILYNTRPGWGKSKTKLIKVTDNGNVIYSVEISEPVTLPFMEPQEEWYMTFDNYKCRKDKDPKYSDLTRDVVLVRDGKDMYIRGIFGDYPEAWVKGTVNGSELSFENGQVIASDEGGNVYFYCGESDYYQYFGNNPSETDDFAQSSSFATFIISQDGNSMTLNDESSKSQNDQAFWYTSGRQGSFMLGTNDRHYWFPEIYEDKYITTGWGFPELDYPINVTFHKGNSGIVSVGNDSGDSSAPMYNLQGQVVNPATAVPGIYIRNGRKIVITRR